MKEKRQSGPRKNTVTPGVLESAAAAHRSGDLARARTLYCEALDSDPGNADALHLLGVVESQQGNHEAALGLIRGAISRQAGTALFHSSLGQVYARIGKAREAEAAYREALRLAPELADTHYRLGNLLRAQERAREAEAAFREALRLDPQLADAALSLGNLHRRRGELEAAEACYRDALERRPDYVEARVNLGVVLRARGRIEDAIAQYRIAREQRPDLAQVHCNLGNALHAQCELGSAIAAYREAVRLNPEYAEARLNLGIALLLAGEFEEGWREYEWRWRSPAALSLNALRGGFTQPAWDGGPVAGRRILLQAEQGYGDAIQFARFAAEVARRGAQVIVECQPELKRLLGSATGVHTVVGRDEHLPAFDLHCPLLSLGRVLGVQPATLLERVPYVGAAAADVARWRERLATTEGDRGNLRVGLAWAGVREHSNDHNRSLTLAALYPLAATPGITFYSVQKGPESAQSAQAPAGMRLLDFTQDLRDFADTAALMMSLDLVITVDTAVAHLAGALGQPVWVLLPFHPDWRWQLAREDSPWYPTMRLLRQGVAGDWSDPVGRAAAALGAIARSLRTPGAAPADPEFPALLKQSFDSYQRGDHPAAEQFAWKAVALEPTNPDILGLLSAVGLARRDFPAGENWSRQALRHAPASPQLHVSLGYALRNQGHHDEAIACYRTAVELRPDFAEGWHRLGQALRAGGKPQEAQAAVRRALEANPDYAAAWITTGHVLQDLGRPQEAIDAYREATKRNSESAEALVGLGTALQTVGAHDDAVASHREAIRLRPEFPEAHNNLANALKAVGRPEEALGHYREALRLRPGYHEALLNSGIALQESGKTEEAIPQFQAAIATRPDSPQAHMALGTAYQDRGKLEQAEECYREALRVSPDYPEALSNRGVALQELGRLEEALASHERALELRPGNPDVLMNLGVALKECGRLDEAIARYEEALASRPGFEGGLINLGAALNEKGQIPEALEAYHRAVAANPRSPDAHWNNSLALLLKGDYEQGWREYEWRWESETARRARVKKPVFDKPEWTGQDLPAQTRILLVAEQGYGDAIQFARYVPLLARRQLRVTVQCHKELVRIFWGLDGVERVLPFGAALPEFDTWCPMLSLALAFGTTVETIPAEVPYLKVETDKVARWRSVLEGDPARLKVGIVWAGRPEHRNDRNRSLTLAHLAPLAAGIEGVSFYSLQKGPRAADAAQPPAGMRLNDVSAMLEDFADTAALVTQLDLVIAVDTAVLHLTAALGKPAWGLLAYAPDWRWFLAREDSPWYPTVRLFRQARPREWASATEQAAQALRALAASRTAAAPAQGAAPSLAYGIACHRAGKLQEAEVVYRGLLESDSRHSDALHLMGVLATQGGRDDEAETRIRHAIEVNPRAPEYWNSLGNVLRQLNRAADAEDAYREALRLNPDYAEAHNNLALLLKVRGELEGALAGFREALRLQPRYVEGHVNLGNALQALGRFEDALAAYGEALRLQPRYPEALMNLGNALQRLGRLTEAISRTREALSQRPDYTIAHMNLGYALQSQGQVADALSCYRAALQLKPDYVEAHWNYSLALLLSGDLREGFREYEWRWKWKDFPSPQRNFPQPAWRGEDITGKVILLHAEQVFGDTVHFIRYAPLVAGRGAKVVVECQPELMRLFRSVPGIHQLVAQGRPLPAFDVHCPLLSLPLALGHDLESIPKEVPYLAPDPAQREAWRKRVGSGFKVGIAWAGSPHHKNDHNRSLSLAALGTLARVPGVVFYSIQKGPAASQAGTPPAGMRLIDLTAELRDFADTAALVANLDLVICVDTAPAHLAGALGKPVWVLLPYAPDWRWLQEREDSPWYPTMRLFRQKSWGDWDPVLERVTQALGRQAGAAPAPAVAVQPQDLLKEAVQRHQSGDHRAAESLYRRVLAAEPDNADALHLLGVTLRQLKQHEDAEQCIRRAIAARPETATYHASFGNLHKDRARYEEAAASYREALRLKPDYAEVHYNLGTTLHHLNRLDEALAHFREATRHNPSFAEAWYNLGNVLQDREAFDEARACYERAIELKPGDVRAHSNLGTVHIQEGRVPAAIDAFEAAIAVDGGSADAHWNLSLALLLTGDFRRGWQEYEWRWKTVDGRKVERRFPRPRFTGQDPQGRRILLHAEQGFGDAIQFVRYAALLAARGATIIVESRPETARLFTRAAGVSQVVTSGSALPEFDLHSPLLSLPGALGTTLETVPSAVPYLSPAPELVDRWRPRILAGAPGLRVGLVWAGRPEHPHDRFRSMAMDHLAPLLAVPGVSWYSLQKSIPGAFLHTPGKAAVVDFTADLGDFADTAAVVSQLDLVVCVDTSVAHLAGALAKPVWVMLPFAPDWRWLVEREDSPWYPTARLFRQKRAGDWPGVIGHVADSLTELTRSPISGPN